MKYRKKPVEIESVEFTGVNHDEIADFCLPRQTYIGTESGTLLIETLEGKMLANKGDFIIKGVKGETYPCKPDIFAMTYEAV
jgi:hypothetical protein